jgi:hypothetical protein
MRRAETPITAWGIWLGLAQIATGIGCAAMPLFKVGDRVERIGVLVPIWMQVGIVTKVIPNKHAMRALPKAVFPFPLNAQEDGIT